VDARGTQLAVRGEFEIDHRRHAGEVAQVEAPPGPEIAQAVGDEASAIEYLGLQPLLVRGHPGNLKITEPADLDLARSFLDVPPAAAGKLV